MRGTFLLFEPKLLFHLNGQIDVEMIDLILGSLNIFLKVASVKHNILFNIAKTIFFT